MIRAGRPQDKKAIYDLHTARASLEPDREMELYFSRFFDASNIIVNEVNGHVGASLQVNYHDVIFNDTRIGVSTILGQICQYDKPEYMDELLKDVLDEQEHKTLISIMITDKPQNYSSYGFEQIYKRKTYELTRANLKNRSYQGVDKPFTVNELVDTYKQFMASFNGYYERNNNYWINMFDQLQATRSNLVVYRNEEGKVEGYMIYRLSQNVVYVDEIIYLNGEALIRLLCYGFKFKNKMEVTVSQQENLAVAIPKIKATPQLCAMARINDFNLFNQLMDSQVKSTKQAFGLSSKPQWFNEKG